VCWTEKRNQREKECKLQENELRGAKLCRRKKKKVENDASGVVCEKGNRFKTNFNRTCRYGEKGFGGEVKKASHPTKAGYQVFKKQRSGNDRKTGQFLKREGKVKTGNPQAICACNHCDQKKRRRETEKHTEDKPSRLLSFGGD